MIKLLRALLLTAVIVLLAYAVPNYYKLKSITADHSLRVLVVYNEDSLEKDGHILKAYQSVLAEEGVPHKIIEVFDLLNMKPGDIVGAVPVLIFPDGVMQVVPSEFIEWIKDYMSKGGSVAVVYDAGTKHGRGFFEKKAVFADITGLNYILTDKLQYDSFEKAQIVFTSNEQRDALQIPFGKTLGGRVLSSYFFGALEYPVYMNEKVRPIPEKNIYAEAFITGTEQKIPAIVITDYGKGKVLYVNLPLGQLKAIGDDLPLRACLRAFLFDAVGIPHIMNVEDGKGTFLFNWHVDSRREISNLSELLDTPIFVKEFNATYHITAGDFLNREGDDEGFYVRERGRELTEIMTELGEVGSHGGWAHNWFSFRLMNGKFSKDDIIKHIKDNSDDIEAVTGKKVTSYSAPNGVHPQPLLTNIIKDMGMIAYYYTGDTGSAPHRAFFGNEMISERIIAFPIMPFGKAASLWEMYDKYDMQRAEIEYFYQDVLDYVEKNKSARLIYAHPADVVDEYVEVMSIFAQEAIGRAAAGRIRLSGMSEYSRFLLRMLNTEYSFTREGSSLKVSLANPESLRGITFTLPKNKYLYQPPERITQSQDTPLPRAQTPEQESSRRYRYRYLVRHYYRLASDGEPLAETAGQEEETADESFAETESGEPTERDEESAAQDEEENTAREEPDILVAEDEKYYYITINDDSKERIFLATVK
ncbi:MAG: polysaccharide deacetylase family protein [Acidaminococcales bacterium]|jgi:hypothetical protein|nr:polysaccharide deacetylase family protein [Acidaminococcales bacterium]